MTDIVQNIGLHTVRNALLHVRAEALSPCASWEENGSGSEAWKISLCMNVYGVYTDLHWSTWQPVTELLIDLNTCCKL